MKWLRYSLWITATAVLLLWLARQATPTAQVIAPPDMEQLQSPAPYPANFEQQLAAEKRVKISLHSAHDRLAALPWQSATEAPTIGDSRARKGGTLRQSNTGPFPAHFLRFGNTSPQFFHYNLFERIEIPLVWAHPETGQEMAGVAEAWCRQGRSLYFKLNPQARYTNGRPVRARDYALGALLSVRCGTPPPCEEIRCYGDSVVEVIVPESYADILTISSKLIPAEPGFYSEFGSDYTERYARRIPPSTGAYTITEIERGRRIVLQRCPNWWAQNLAGFTNTHNIDRIEYHFFTDEAQTWQAFINGRLDILQTRNIAAWQTKLDGVRAAEDGRISLHSLRIVHPMPPYGIALNTRTLPDLQLRKGLLQALDMKTAIEVLFRGYAEQLPHFTTGYRNLQHDCPQYRYNPSAARKCFALAGFTECGPDGILRRPNGERLSVRFSFSPSEKLNTLATILAQSAAACGAELVPEPLPWQNISRQLKDSSHELTFWATMPSLPIPAYERFFHSKATGHDAPFGLVDNEIDNAILRAQQAKTQQQASAAAKEIDELIYQRAVWLPGWMENRANIAAWQHVKLPTRYHGPYDVAESHQLWIAP